MVLAAENACTIGIRRAQMQHASKLEHHGRQDRQRRPFTCRRVRITTTRSHVRLTNGDKKSSTHVIVRRSSDDEPPEFLPGCAHQTKRIFAGSERRRHASPVVPSQQPW